MRDAVKCIGTNGHEEREQNDYYSTNPLMAEMLTELVKLDKNIWECACGEGHISKALVSKGYNVRSTDLINRGYGSGGIDFLSVTEKFNGDIVTNPPYKDTINFIRHSLELVPEGHLVCMFLKLQYLEGKKRRKLYDEYPPKYVYVSTSRVACGKGGVYCDSAIAYAWYIWEKGYKGDTILRWFN